MKTRIISALVALPLLIFVIVSGGMWTHIGIAVLGLVGMYEFNKAISKEVKGTHIIAYLFGLIYVIFIDKIIYTAPLFSVFASLFTIALLVYSVLCYKKTNYVEVVAALFGFFYACFLLSHVYLVREYDHGKLLIWLAFISAFGCDTGAYFTGYFLGKNKLCPALSPKKTIEGSVGGIITSIVLCLLWDYFTGWRGWSTGYVLTTTSVGLVIFYFVMGIADRSRYTTYTGYFMISEIGIVVCFILNLLGVFCGIAEYFAVMAVSVGLLLFLAQVVFRGKGFFSELHRWLHL